MITILFSYIVIPFSTFYLARDTDYFNTNFSSICSVLSRRWELLAWCSLTGGYFLLTLCRLTRQADRYLSNLRFTIRQGQLILCCLVCLTILFMAFPYLPEQHPFLSAIHIVSALIVSVSLFICLTYLALRIYFADPDNGRRFLMILIAAASFCLSSWILSGIINSAMEICIVFTACYLIRQFSVLFAYEFD